MKINCFLRVSQAFSIVFVISFSACKSRVLNESKGTCSDNFPKTEQSPDGDWRPGDVEFLVSLPKSPKELKHKLRLIDVLTSLEHVGLNQRAIKKHIKKSYGGIDHLDFSGMDRIIAKRTELVQEVLRDDSLARFAAKLEKFTDCPC